jgi:hypothetical protein
MRLEPLSEQAGFDDERVGAHEPEYQPSPLKSLFQSHRLNRPLHRSAHASTKDFTDSPPSIAVDIEQELVLVQV